MIEFNEEVHKIGDDLYGISCRSEKDEFTIPEVIQKSADFTIKILNFLNESNLVAQDIKFIYRPCWVSGCLAQFAIFCAKIKAIPRDQKGKDDTKSHQHESDTIQSQYERNKMA